MSLLRCIHAAVLITVLACIAARPAMAGPMAFASELPLSDDDVSTLRARLDAGEYLRTVDFLATLRVFEDEASTPARPIFYLAPVFTADRSQDAIGGQEIATALLDLLDKLDLLLDAFHASHRERDRLETGRADYLAVADQLIAMFGVTPPADIQRLIDYAVTGNPNVAQLDQLPARIAAAMNALPSFLRRQIAAEVLRGLDRLQVPLTAAEREQASSNPVQFVLAAPLRIRAKLATLLFGVRHARFVHGMTTEQVRLLGHYRAIRPDVTLSALPLQLLRVVPISSVIDGGSELGSVSAPLMIRGVNASTGGVCGLTTSCTVIIEYAEIGARSALLASRGASIMPAQFVGEVAVAAAPPPRCDIAALRRRLILPFGIGVLADREISRVIPEPGICTGSATTSSKLSSSIALADAYRGLLFEPAQLSAFRRKQLSSELQGLVATDSRVLGRLGIVGTLLRLLDPRGFFDRFSHRQFSRLMPRFPDELVAGLIVASRSAPKAMTFDFDGIAIACWKRGADGGPYLSACPDDAPPADIQVATAETLEARHCTGIDLIGCVTAIQAGPPDARGFLWID
jgi:hypothetical protein